MLTVSECVIIAVMSSSGLARALSLFGFTLLTELAAPGIAPATEPSVVNEVQDLLQISAPERRSLVRGEVISLPVTENSERELAVGSVDRPGCEHLRVRQNAGRGSRRSPCGYAIYQR